jgi:gluconate 2-dehydrogenase gamma chain
LNREGGSSVDTSRRRFLKIGAGVAAGAALASAVEVPFLGDRNFRKDQEITALQNQLALVKQAVGQSGPLEAQVNQLTAQAAQLQTQADSVTGFLYLNQSEQLLLEAIAEAVIPSDSSGPGAKEAGVIYFIDRQLASDYGSCGTMYMQGPYVPSGQAGPITVGNIVYPHGTPAQSLTAGTRYQYAMDLRYFWRFGLDAFRSYCNTHYGANFRDLATTKQMQALNDLWNNKPPSFNGIVPVDFANELYMMIWAGFLMDPIHGGNRGMVGWEYVGFTGVNQGNFYGEGHSPEYLMTVTTPVRLKPASLRQFQRKSQLL